MSFTVGYSEQEGLGVSIIFWESVELSDRNLFLWKCLASLHLIFTSTRSSGWDKDCLGCFIDLHRVLLLPEPVFVLGFLLVQLTCLVSEIFHPCRYLGMVYQWWEAMAVSVRQQLMGRVDRALLSSLVKDFCFVFLRIENLREVNTKQWG